MKDILVAIDLGVSTPLVIKQVIELTGGEGTSIHLVHVCTRYGGSRTVEIKNNDDPEYAVVFKKMEQWRDCLQEAIPKCAVKGYLLKGRLQQCLLDVANAIKPQLIITGKPGKKQRFAFGKQLNTDKLSLLSKCPVLSIENNELHSSIKKIIVPVRDFIPLRKMELLVVFAKIYRATVFLVAMQNGFFKNEKQRHALLESYSILLNGIGNRVECQLLKGNNLPRAVAAYARETGADILIANPGKETRLPGIFNTAITDILPAGSQLKILSVIPYQDM